MEKKSWPLVWLGTAVEGGLGVVALAIAWPFELAPWGRWHWRVDDLGYGLLAAVPMLLGFFAALRWPVGPLARIKRFSERLLATLFADASIVDLAMLSLAAGFGEEFLFRGLIQSGVAAWIGLTGGIVVAAVLFGLMHFITPTYAVLATGLGVYLGWLTMATDNLLPATVAHALYDFVALVWLTLSLPKDEDREVDQEADTVLSEPEQKAPLEPPADA
jgi:membrane protease YdiL (CAAX protease family)